MKEEVGAYLTRQTRKAMKEEEGGGALLGERGGVPSGGGR